MQRDRKHSGERILGPYRDRDGWKYIYRDRENKGTSSPIFREKRDAEAWKIQLLRTIKAREVKTVMDAIEDYAEHLRAKGNKERSIVTSSIRLQGFFGVKENPARTFSECDTQTLYGELCNRVSVDTHRNMLAQAKTFATWCMTQGWLSKNPLAEIHGVGKRRHGKPQLRIDETRKWVAKAYELADGDNPDGPVSALTVFFLAVRSSEVVVRKVRDLDDDGAVLWFSDTKTAAGDGAIAVPDELRIYLKRLCVGKTSEDFIFGRPGRKTPYLRNLPRAWARKIALAAGVPVICAHALKGMHGTILKRRGETGAIIAAALGHREESTSYRSYVQASATREATQRDLMKVLKGGK